MDVVFKRFILALCIGSLSFGISQIIPSGIAYGNEGEDDEDEQDQPQSGAEESGEEKGGNLAVHFEVNSEKVNPLVRGRYKIYAKVDPQKPQSKRFLFNLENKQETSGDLTFSGVGEGEKLQVYVVKDNYQRDCNPSSDLKDKMEKESTINEVPASVSIELVQQSKYLNEKDLKKLSGYDSVPECTITAIESKE